MSTRLFKSLNFDAHLMVAIFCSAALMGSYLGLRSLRDALLQNWDVKTVVPNIRIATAVVAIGVAFGMSRLLRKATPLRLMRVGLLASAASALLTCAAVLYNKGFAGVVLYLHLAVFGSTLLSIFSLVLDERYDPRAIKRVTGMIAAGGTVGGLVVCLLVAIIRQPLVLLPIFAGLHVACALMISAFKAKEKDTPALPKEAPPLESPLGILRDMPYLRTLALLLFLVSTSTFLLDYIMQNQVQAFYKNRGEAARTAFFGWYYCVIPLVTLVLQASFTRALLEKGGLALTAGLSPAVVLTGGIGVWLAPVFPSAVLLRGADNACRTSFFRAAYDLLFTPVPPDRRKSVKSVMDLGCSNSSDILGGLGASALRLSLPAAFLNPVSLAIAMALAGGSLLLAWRLRTGYVRELEISLLNQSVDLDPAEIKDGTTHTVLLKTAHLRSHAERQRNLQEPHAPAVTPHADPMLARIMELRSQDPLRVRHALAAREPVEPAVIAAAVHLLGREDIAREAGEFLSAHASAHTGQLVDALLNERLDLIVRRRLAKILGACGRKRAADGLLLALEDPRFELRYQCGRALAAIAEAEPKLRFDSAQVFAAVMAEVSASGSAWESQLELMRGAAPDEPELEQVVQERSQRSLEHVFTILSLVLPREPLRIAYQALHSHDENLRGTVLEYLESTLPDEVRGRLWPFLEDLRKSPLTRPRAEVLWDIVGSHESLVQRLASGKQKGAGES